MHKLKILIYPVNGSCYCAAVWWCNKTGGMFNVSMNKIIDINSCNEVELSVVG